MTTITAPPVAPPPSPSASLAAVAVTISAPSPRLLAYLGRSLPGILVGHDAEGLPMLRTSEGIVTLTAAGALHPSSRVTLHIRQAVDGALHATLTSLGARGDAPPTRSSSAAGGASPAPPPVEFRVLVVDASARTPLQPGDSLLVRILGASSNNPMPAQAPVGATFTATVTAGGGQGVKVETPFGELATRTAPSVMPGMVLTLAPTDARPNDNAAARLIGDMQDEWPALRKAIEGLKATAPEMAARLLAALPQPGEHLAARTIAFVLAVRDANLRHWLPEPALNALLTSDGGGPLNQLANDFSRMGRLADSGSEWRGYLVPLYDGSELRQMRIFLRKPPKGSRRRDADAGTRFMVDLQLTRLGAFQFEGLYRARHVSLIVRTERPVPAAIPANLDAIFRNSLAAHALTGELCFEAGVPFNRTPLELIGPRAPSILV